MNTLDSARSEFNLQMKLAFQESGLSETDFDKMGFVEFAKHISNPVTKRNYNKLAIKLLEENIRALQTDNQDEYTSEWANNLLMWCKAREELRHA